MNGSSVMMGCLPCTHRRSAFRLLHLFTRYVSLGLFYCTYDKVTYESADELGRTKPRHLHASIHHLHQQSRQAYFPDLTTHRTDTVTCHPDTLHMIRKQWSPFSYDPDHSKSPYDPNITPRLPPRTISTKCFHLSMETSPRFIPMWHAGIHHNGSNSS